MPKYAAIRKNPKPELCSTFEELPDPWHPPGTYDVSISGVTAGFENTDFKIVEVRPATKDDPETALGCHLAADGSVYEVSAA
jgi:hypothetical protein